MSYRYRLFKTISFLAIQFRVVICKISNLLISQCSPLNPWVQLQVNELIPSVQTPSFLQGFLGLQSSISKN